MALQGRKSSPQKSRPLESGNRRCAVWIAIEYSYKLGQKNEFKFWCELGWFLLRQSQLTITCNCNYSQYFLSLALLLVYNGPWAHLISLYFDILMLTSHALLRQHRHSWYQTTAITWGHIRHIILLCSRLSASLVWRMGRSLRL